MNKNFELYIHPKTGIRCLHQKCSSPVAYINISINSGTRDEREGAGGVAHMTEHLLFKGTHKRNAFHISNLLESRGGDLNAYTTKEETVVHCCALKDSYSRAFELLVDMCFNSRFAQKEIDSEREIIYDEINSYKDSPAELIFDDFEEQLFAGSALGRNILGNKRQLASLTQSDLLDYTRENFTSDRMVIASSGNITMERFKRVCDKHLESLNPTSSTHSRIAPQRVQAINITRNKKTHQQHTLIGGYAYSLFDQKRIPLSLLSNIIAGPFSLSLLNQSLREKNSITYNVESNYTPYSDSGLFSVYLGLDSAKSDQAESIIEKEFNALRTTPMSSGKFHRFKRQFLGQMMISSDNRESMAQAVAKSMMVFGEFDSIEKLYQKIEALTPHDIMDVAAEVLAPENLNKLIYR